MKRRGNLYFSIAGIQRNPVYIILYKEIKLIATLCLEAERESLLFFFLLWRERAYACVFLSVERLCILSAFCRKEEIFIVSIVRIQRNSVYILLYKEIKLISTLCLEKERNSAVLYKENRANLRSLYREQREPLCRVSF